MLIIGLLIAATLYLFLGAVIFSTWARFLRILLALARAIPHMIASLPNEIASLCDTLDKEGSAVWRDLKPLTKTPRIVNILTGFTLAVAIYVPGAAFLALLFSIFVYGFVKLTLMYVYDAWSMLWNPTVGIVVALALVVLATGLFFESRTGSALLSFLSLYGPTIYIIIVIIAFVVGVNAK